MPSVRALSLTYAKSFDQWYNAHSPSPNPIIECFPSIVELTLIGITNDVVPSRAEDLQCYAGSHATGWQCNEFKFPPSLRYFSVQQRLKEETALTIMRALPGGTRVARMQTAFHYDCSDLSSEFKEVLQLARTRHILLATEHKCEKLSCRKLDGSYTHDKGRQLEGCPAQRPSGWFEREFLTV